MRRLLLTLTVIIFFYGCSYVPTTYPSPVNLPQSTAVDELGAMLAEKNFNSEELRKVQDRILELKKGLDREKVKKYSKLFIKYSEKYDLDVNLVLHISYLESRFEEDVVSRTGDYGLMQINWKAHHRLLQKMGIDRGMLLDPEINLDYACKLLRLISQDSKSLDGIVRKYAPRHPRVYAQKLRRLMSESKI
ncbi:MAG: transglycosylase SLT domain-containing protein [Thermodesulfobacteriota bacterium]